jgi:hypothetical protein
MALDEKGITLAEVEKRYPRSFQLLGYDVLMDTDSMYKPKIISTFEMCVNSILLLLKMKPGQYPSIPELGIDIESYLHEYTDDDKIPLTLQSKLYEQMNRLEITGIDVDIYFDKTSDGHEAMVVKVTGTDRLVYGVDKPTVIIGITYDQLNQLYTRIHWNR